MRQAADAAAYAAATRKLGAETGVPVLDVWGLFMERAGWKEGDAVLPGSKAAGKSEVLAELLVDGEFWSVSAFALASASVSVSVCVCL